MDRTGTIKPLVSILIPAHNAAGTLLVAINSCINQTYDAIEIIVNLNNCTDTSIDILKNIKNQKLRYFETTEPGIANARNALIKAAQGKYIAWLDADDIAMHNRIELQTSYMELHPDVDVLGTQAKLRGGKLKTVHWPTKSKILYNWLFFKNPLIQSSLMLRASLKPNYVSQYDYVEDYEWICRAVNNKEINKIALLPQQLCSYLLPNLQKAEDYNQTNKLEKIMQSQLQHLQIEWNEQSAYFFKLIRGIGIDKNKALIGLKFMLKQPLNISQKAIIYYYLLHCIKSKNTGYFLAVKYAYLLPYMWQMAPRWR